MPAFPLPDDAHVQAIISFVDDANQSVPAPAGATAAWSSSDATVITVVADPSDTTGMTGLVTALGKAGGVGGAVTVGAGALSAIDITFGTPVHN